MAIGQTTQQSFRWGIISAFRICWENLKIPITAGDSVKCDRAPQNTHWRAVTFWPITPAVVGAFEISKRILNPELIPHQSEFRLRFELAPRERWSKIWLKSKIRFLTKIVTRVHVFGHNSTCGWNFRIFSKYSETWKNLKCWTCAQCSPISAGKRSKTWLKTNKKR